MHNSFSTLVIILAFFLPITCVAKNEMSTDKLMQKADSCIREFNYNEAILYYSQLYKITENFNIARKLVEAHKHLGHYKDCISIIRTIPKDSLKYEDLRSLYFSYHNMEKSDSLLFYADSILSLNPFDSEVLVSLATFCNATNRFSKALNACQRYLQKDSLNMPVLRQFGYASYLAGNFQEAYNSYLQLKKYGFENYESSFIMGISLANLGKDSEAYDYLLQASKIKNNNDFSSLYHLGKICISIGLCTDGIAFLEKAIKLQSPDSIMLSTLYKSVAEGYFLSHKYKDAALAFENSSRFESNNPITYYNIAQMYETIGIKDKAKHYYTLFLKYSDKLKNCIENKEMVNSVRKKLNAKKIKPTSHTTVYAVRHTVVPILEHYVIVDIT